MERVTIAGDKVGGVSGPYAQESGEAEAAALTPAAKGRRPVRAFERG